jgi:hypothetical protein
VTHATACNDEAVRVEKRRKDEVERERPHGYLLKQKEKKTKKTKKAKKRKPTFSLTQPIQWNEVERNKSVVAPVQ